jgi:hypothetical protein
MTIEILYFEGCRGYERLLPRVRELAGRCGAGVVLRPVESFEDAERLRFLGSPTVRVDGRDIEPDADERTDYGLKCRLYRSPEHGQSPVPPETWIRAALDRAGA